MPLIPNFSAAQSSGLPSTIVLTDISTGSDSDITARRVYLLQADGTYLVPAGTTTDYILWALIDSNISIDVLTQDTALSITVDWVDINGDTVEQKIISYGFDAYGQTFFYGLSDGQVPITNPSVALSTNYYQNKVQFYCYLVSAAQAITYASDIYRAQVNYDADAYMISNQNNFF